MNKIVQANKEKIIKMFMEDKLAAGTIARTLGVYTGTLVYDLKKWGLPYEPRNLIGEKHPNWKGRVKSNQGYWDIRLPKDDFFYPMARSNNGYVREHRLIMARYLKRCLLPWEVVHHKNNIKGDNRLENLELVSSPYKHNAMTKMAIYIRKLEEENRELKTQLGMMTSL